MTQEQRQEIRRLRAMGEGYKRIGAILNLSVNTVKSFCRRDREEDKPSIEDQPDDCVVCLRCGQTIVQISGRKRRLFCSDACRVAYWRKQAKPKAQLRRCLNCGRLLLGNDSRRKYCDHACYIEHRFGEGGEKHAGERQRA